MQRVRSHLELCRQNTLQNVHGAESHGIRNSRSHSATSQFMRCMLCTLSLQSETWARRSRVIVGVANWTFTGCRSGRFIGSLSLAYELVHQINLNEINQQLSRQHPAGASQPSFPFFWDGVRCGSTLSPSRVFLDLLMREENEK